MPKAEAFLSSIRRNSIKTAIGYKTSLAYFQEFLASQYNHTLESILQALSEEKQEEQQQGKSHIDVYEILEKFITFIQEKEKKKS